MAMTLHDTVLDGAQGSDAHQRAASRLSIRAHLALLVAAAVSPLLLLVIWLLSQMSQQSELLAAGEVRHAATDVAARLDETVREHADLLEALHESPALRALGAPGCAALMHGYLERRPEVNEALLLKADGGVVCAHRRHAANAPAYGGGHEFQQDLARPDFHLGSVQRDPHSGRKLLRLTKPVFGDGAHAVALLVGRIDVDLLATELFRKLPPDTLAALIDNHGQVQADGGSLTPAARPAWTSPDDPDWLRVKVAAAGAGWQVAGAGLRSMAMKPYQTLMWRALGVVALILGLKGFLTWLLAARIAGPVRDIERTSARSAQGDGEARAMAAGPRELYRLALRLNELIDAHDRDQRELIVGRERLQRAMDASGLALWDMDVDSGEVYLSESWSVMLGGPWRPTRCTYEQLAARVPAGEHTALKDALLATLKQTMTHYRVEHRVRRDDGRLMWIVSTGRVVEREPGGHARRMVGTNRDVTERKLAQLLLDGQRQVLELVAKDAPLAHSLHRLAETAIGHADSQMLVALLVAGDDARTLRLVAAPGMPEALLRALDGAAIAADGGLAGLAAHRRVAVWIDDLAMPGAEADAALREHAPALCWNAAWAVPILDAPHHALGTLVMLFQRREPRQAALDAMVQTVVQTAAIAIRHEATRNALQQSAQTLQRTFDHMDQGISIADAELRLTGSNRRFRELLALPEALCRPGVPAEAVFRFNAQRGDYGPGEVEELVAERVHLAAKRQAHRFERETPDGLTIEVRGQPLPDGGFVTTYTDVTHRTRGERALRRFRAALDLSTDGIYLIDAGDLTVLDCNEGACRMLGWARDELLGSPVERFVDSPDRAQLNGDLRRLRGGDLSMSTVQAVHRRRDGSTLQVEVNRRLHHADGLNLVVAVVRDMSDRARAERAREELQVQLRESQKMEAIGTLAGGIAHDFNNILGAILGHVTLARSALPAAHDAQFNLDQVHQAGLRARGLVQQILAFSRRQSPVTRPQDMAALVHEAIALLRPLLPAGVEVVTRLHGAPLYAQVDATQMHQVLINLVTNAWHAMPSGHGHVELGLEPLRVSGAGGPDSARLPAGAYLDLWVADNGSGIAPEQLGRIFEPFFTTKAVGSGTGLGLSVVHGIVTAHRGAIWAESQPGLGSTFHVALPLVEPPASAAPEPLTAAPHARGEGQLVVVIDDDDVMRLLTVQMLLHGGYEVQAFADPYHGLAAASDAGTAVQLLLSDHNMPGLSGLELTRVLSRLRPTLPVLLLSGLITDELRRAAVEAGARALLNKENAYAELLPAVASALAKGPAAPGQKPS